VCFISYCSALVVYCTSLIQRRSLYWRPYVCPFFNNSKNFGVGVGVGAGASIA